MKMKRSKPRLPEEARDKLHKGCAHTDKRKYNRKEDKQSLRQAKDYIK